MRYLERESKPGELDVTQFHWVVLHDGAREIRPAGPAKEVGRASLRLGGQEGWLCWPERSLPEGPHWSVREESDPAIA